MAFGVFEKQRISIGILVLLSCVSLISCGGGGGGGGTIVSPPPVSPPPPPPPPPPPSASLGTGFGFNDCTRAPTSLACSGAAIIMGPSVLLSATENRNLVNGTRNPNNYSNAELSLDPGSPSQWGDETFTFKYKFYDDDPKVHNIPYGKQVIATSFAGLNAALYNCDVTNADCGDGFIVVPQLPTESTGTFDYTIPFMHHSILAGNRRLIYSVMGKQTGAFSPAMLTGSAGFTGTTFGEMTRAETSGRTLSTGKISMRIDLAKGYLRGALSEFKFYKDNQLFNLEYDPSVDFAAYLNASNGSVNAHLQGRDPARGLVGGLFGSFFGETNRDPSEFGFTYLFQSSLDWFVGAGIAKSNPNATIPNLPFTIPSPGPASTRPSGCVLSECITAATDYHGPNFSRRFSGSNPMSSPPVGQSLSTNVDDLTVTIDPGATASASDDIYTIKINNSIVNINQSFTNSAATSDILGRFANFNSNTAGFAQNLRIFDVSSALTGSLDFVQMAAFKEEVAGGMSNQIFFVYGNQTKPVDMPTSGSATFEGYSRGMYYDDFDNLTFETTSDVTMNVNFMGMGSIDGRMSNFRFIDKNGNFATRSEDLTSRFLGFIRGSYFDGTFDSNLSGGAQGYIGNFQGAFYGETNKPPTQAGFVYRFGQAGNMGRQMWGAAVLSKKN